MYQPILNFDPNLVLPPHLGDPTVLLFKHVFLNQVSATIQNNMKHLLTAIAITLAMHNCAAQTELGPALGFDIAQVREGAQDEIYYDVYKDGYATRSPLFGLTLEKPISKKMVIAADIGYMRKKAETYVFVARPIERVKFHYWRANFLAQWYLSKAIFVGAGPALNYRGKVIMYYEDGSDDPFIGLKQRAFSLGATLLAGLKLNQFRLEAYFNKPLLAPKDKPRESNFKPINAFGLTAGYMFQLRGEGKVYGF